MELPKRRYIIIAILFFSIVIFYTTISHKLNLKKDYSLKLNFIVAQKKDRVNAFCDLYDKNKNEIPLKSYTFYKGQVYEGDSIVKKDNSYLVYIYRKKNWLHYGNDNSYFVAAKINLN
jgi:hypothetical protein